MHPHVVSVNQHRVLVAEAIGKTYGRRQVLTSAYLHAEAGRVVGLVGRNGAGKTTLLKIAAGLIAPTHGSVFFAGRLHSRPKLHNLARQGLFYIPADRSYLSPRTSIADHLRVVQAQKKSCGDLDDVLHSLELFALRDQRVGGLSSGERRRAQLALALLRQPTCLLADELFRDLAPRTIELVSDSLRSMAASGCAIVVTGHELSFVFALVDEIIWVTSGTTEVLGAPCRAKANWRFQREFLGLTT